MHDSSKSEPSAADGLRSMEDLQAALAAERARVREVEHRAKNTLQLVSSLILLLSRRSPHEETRAALKSMHQLVAALAAVHRDFMDAGGTGPFDLTKLVRERAAAVAQSQGGAVRLDLEALEAPAAAACPLALIITELVLNALRHGADASGRATVDVALRRSGAGFELSVGDEGPGPQAVPVPGFGLNMVRMLAQQLGAEFVLEDAQPGLRAVVRSP